MRYASLFATVLACLGILGQPGSCQAGEPVVSPDQARFFETRIRPLLVEQCQQCHGTAKQKADLRLDSAEALRQGGESGPVIVPGQPEKSLLLRAVSYQDDALRMPPKQQLSAQQIADLTQWVRRGAPWPARAAGKPADRDAPHWAFQPPADPPVPAVQDRNWPCSPLDHFVLAQLEAAGLRPAPPADRRTLIRRVTFDLTGLPPTPAEVEAFLADRSPDAFARVVDRLLASPRYGERWGRHWLDVARYADSNGLDENIAHGNAWRYRDYVVAAFNRDKPYDQFLLEQIAGDLLPGADRATRHERLIATGFLALGPKVLAEVDEKKMEMDIVDEQLDTLGRAVMGLTLGCARCHDHKFDPFDTEDYYGLAGIFTSTRTMEHFKKIARWHENVLASEEELALKAAHDRKVARLKDMIQQTVRRGNEEARLAKPGMALPKNAESLYAAPTRAELKHLRAELADLEKAAPVLPSAMGVTEGTVADVAVHIRGSHLKLGAVVPRRFPRVLTGDQQPTLSAGTSGRLELAQWLVRPSHPLTGRVMVNRLWRWHFGRGLVATPDNFGRLGERPSHPALLDWLTHRFIASGWSMKAMHRLFLLSSTYQMSSLHDAQAAAKDPENRLYWRAPVRRLEAEAIRDALLAVSGLLDPHMGGSLLHVKNREFLFDHTSKDTTTYDSRRRSLYLPVIRNHLYDVFQLFDFTDATVGNGDRTCTTVAPQALFMLNSDLMLQASEALASRLLAAAADPAARIHALYRLAYGRDATPTEIAAGQELVRACEETPAAQPSTPERRRLEAWACLCQVVLAANEFLTIN